jgi:uncharacterized 2Fe-2S/4Fe-4S cluster protein (DUF4445 family)
MPQTFSIDFMPMGKRAVCTGDEVLIEVARRQGVRIASACGGRGRCRSCAVRMEGAVPAATAADREQFSADELAAGWRRACQVHPVGACTVHVPAKTAAGAVSLGQDAGVAMVPIRAPILQRVDNDGIFRRGDHVVGPLARGQALGLAVDLGTTNLAAALIDLQSGRVVATAAKENPQAVFGADVISRLMQALRGEAVAHELQSAAAGAIAELAAGLTSGSPQSVAEVAVVGNSVMQHLLLGLPVDSLARAPYQPHTYEAVDVRAASLGLDFAPGAWLHFGPNVAGFVGSDHVAALLETLADPPPGCWALLDIGTNTEISLFKDGQLTCVSCASGPAFEGGLLSCGMRAAPGAIEKVRMDGERLRLDTIDNADPAGICGSGVLSLVSELRRAGAVNARGRLASGHPRVRERGHKLEFVLADEKETGALAVVFTQDDLRAVQLAKAAIRAGLDLLLANSGVREDNLDRIIVAGAFGKYIDIDEAVNIGLLPPVPRERIVQVGNAAGAGVRRILACAGARAQAHALARQARYLELASRPEFQETFIRRISL